MAHQNKKEAVVLFSQNYRFAQTMKTVSADCRRNELQLLISKNCLIDTNIL